MFHIVSRDGYYNDPEQYYDDYNSYEHGHFNPNCESYQSYHSQEYNNEDRQFDDYSYNRETNEQQEQDRNGYKHGTQSYSFRMRSSATPQYKRFECYKCGYWGHASIDCKWIHKQFPKLLIEFANLKRFLRNQKTT